FPEQGAALQSGMARLVEAGLEPLAIDAAPVNQARRILLQQTPAEELYANLKRIALNSAIPDFRLSNLGGAGGGFGGDVVTSPASVPGLFTADGFYNVFLRYLPTLTTSSAEDDWMFDAGSILAASASQDKLIQQVSDLYVADYVQQWRTLISSIRLYDFHSIDDAGQTLDRLAGPDSPLRAVLVALRNNVALPPPGAPSSATSAAAPATAPGGLAERAFGGLSRLVSNASASPSPATASPGAASAAPGAAQDGVAGDPTVPPPIAGPNWPGTRIAQAFQPLTSLVDGGDTRQQGIDTVLNAIANLSATVKSIASASNPPQAAYQFAAGRVSGHPGQQGDALTAVRRFGDRQPDPVRMWLYTLSGYSWEAIMGFARGAVEDAWEHQVVPEWRRSMLDRYPIFADSKTETSLKDFGTFFGPDGVLDKFFQNWLSPFVNTNGITWESARIDGQSLDIAPDALDQLQQAALIRQAFFPESGSNMPKVHFTLEPTLLGARSIQIQLAIEDSTLIYRHDPPRAWKLTWPGDTSPGTMRITLTDVQNRNWSMEKDGVWALFRLLDSTHLHGTASDDRFLLNLTLGDVPASFELRADSANGNPFDLSLLHDFRLPDHVM
ncbi:MAG TPA: ImcF-related family protein, partial [Stellaceae bacterium]|nr:ImcF-related family protein [Stellaceae bacterium]